MFFIAFLLPLLAVGAAFLWGVDPTYWWAYTLIAFAAEGLDYWVFRLKTTSKEYLSGYVTSVIHHFAWVERRETTELKTGANGKTYTVKKVEYIDHPDEYFWGLNTGKSQGISADTFYHMSHLWGTGRHHIPVYHANCVSGGDGEESLWDGREYNTQTVTYTHRYRNPVKNSNSVFRGRHIGKEEAAELGLFNYPKVAGLEQQVVMVHSGLTCGDDIDDANFQLQHLNAFCGLQHEIHSFILLFPAEAGVGIAFKQRDYWEGCNKNEFVVCLGVDGDKVAWCHTLSWMDAPTLDVAVKDYFLHNPSLRLSSFVSWLRDHLDLWKRKEFKDFRYLGWNMSHSGSTLFWLVALAGSVATLLCSFWIGGWPSDIRHEREALLAAERERVELVQLTNAAQRRAPGTYFFAAGSDIFRVEVASDGTSS